MNRNVAYDPDHLRQRIEFDAIVTEENRTDGPEWIDLPDVLYRIRRTEYSKKIFSERINMEYVQFVVCMELFLEDTFLTELRCYDVHDLFVPIRHRNGRLYGFYRTELYGHSIFDFDTLKSVHYVPEHTEIGEEFFIAVDAIYSPVHHLLAVSGCYWACPWRFEVYDFSNPETVPLPIVFAYEDFEPGESADPLHWNEDGTLTAKFTKAHCEPEIRTIAFAGKVGAIADS